MQKSYLITTAAAALLASNTAAGADTFETVVVSATRTEQPVEKTGAWSTGEFVTTLEDLLSIYTAANFRRGADDQIQGRKAYTYNFTVLQENSNWDIIAPGGAKASPSYSGTLWIDQESFAEFAVIESAETKFRTVSAGTGLMLSVGGRIPDLRFLDFIEVKVNGGFIVTRLKLLRARVHDELLALDDPVNITIGQEHGRGFRSNSR